MIEEVILYLLMIFVVIVTIKPKNLKDFLKKLSFKKIKFWDFLSNISKYTIFLLISSMLIGLLAIAIGLQEDAGLVKEIISQIPIQWVLVSVFCASIAEEIMFRGLLTKKVGIWASSFLFAISHAGYGSLTEMVGAFVLGAILAKQFIKTNNIWNVIITHLLYNLIVVSIIFSV